MKINDIKVGDNMGCCKDCIYRDLCFSEWLKHEISEGTCLLANDDEFRKLENGQHIPL